MSICVPPRYEGRFAIVTMRGRDAVDGAARLTKRGVSGRPKRDKGPGRTGRAALRTGAGVMAAKPEAPSVLGAAKEPPKAGSFLPSTSKP